MDEVLLRSCEDAVFTCKCDSESFIMGAEADSLTDCNGKRSAVAPATAGAGSKTPGNDASGLEGRVEVVCSSAGAGFETEFFLGNKVVEGGTDVDVKVGVEAMVVSEPALVFA